MFHRINYRHCRFLNLMKQKCHLKRVFWACLTFASYTIVLIVLVYAFSLLPKGSLQNWHHIHRISARRLLFEEDFLIVFQLTLICNLFLYGFNLENIFSNFAFVTGMVKRSSTKVKTSDQALLLGAKKYTAPNLSIVRGWKW